MGFLRTYLAICVLVGHSYGPIFVDGRYAVQVFYVMSGFLMALTLSSNESYQKNKLAFYKRRLQRLFPLYLITLLMTVGLIGIGNVKDIFVNESNLIFAWFVISQIIIISQDLVFFIDNSTLELTSDYRLLDPQIWKFMYVPQSWTLSLELYFYLIIPFIIRNLRLIIIIFFLSFAIKIYTFSIGLGRSDPWTYRFFYLKRQHSCLEQLFISYRIISKDVIFRKFL